MEVFSSNKNFSLDDRTMYFVCLKYEVCGPWALDDGELRYDRYSRNEIFSVHLLGEHELYRMFYGCNITSPILVYEITIFNSAYDF